MLGSFTAALLVVIGRGHVNASIVLGISALATWLALIPALADPGSD